MRSKIDELEAEIAALRDDLEKNVAWLHKAEKDRAELLDAAVAVVDRWDTPLWKDAEHTGVTIGRLRKAIINAGRKE